MTLTVENGTGLATAESYISVADADARATAFGNTAWTGTEAAKEAALRRATAYLEQQYRNRWKGTRLLRDQALSWPRYGAEVDGYDIDSTVVPREVANVCADLAAKALTTTLSADVERTAIREKVGPIEVEYSPYSPTSTRYVAVSDALAPFLTGSANCARLVRV